MTELQITTRPAREKALFFYSQNHKRKRRSRRSGASRLKSKEKIFKTAGLLLVAHVLFFLTVVDVQSTQAFELIGSYLAPTAQHGAQSFQEYMAAVNTLADKVAIVAMPVVIALGAYMAVVLVSLRNSFTGLMKRG